MVDLVTFNQSLVGSTYCSKCILEFCKLGSFIKLGKMFKLMELSSVKNSNLKLRIGFLAQCYKKLQLFSLQSAVFFV
jgi:hypothetical protein